MADHKIIFSMQGVGKTFKDKKVLDNISLSFYFGARIGVLGLNGSGKSTLLKIVAGLDEKYIGKIHKDKDVTFGYLHQEPELDASKTVLQVVKEGVKPLVDLLEAYEAVNSRFAEPDADMDKLMEQQASLHEKIEALDGWELDARLAVAMDALRCPEGETSVKNLSGGERRRVALCRLLLQKPDVLLLDEPTNHLDAESVAWLEIHLNQYPGTVIAVTHDRYFLENVAGWILELDRGKGIPFEGNYSSWLEQKNRRLEQEAKGEDKRRKAFERELDWVRQNPKGRQAKSKARISQFEALQGEEAEKQREEIEIPIPAGPRLGDTVIVAEGVSKAFGDKLLYDNLNFRLPRGGIVGIIGPNGAGKTTLFRLITGTEKPDGGNLTVGDTVKLGYADQARTLNPDRQIWQEISDGQENVMLGKKQVAARSYAARFNFTGHDQQKKVTELSGGERNRVHLAKVLKEGANVLLLDEPTNDLDVNTLRALEESLLAFPGCAVIISHDRWFLDRVATHILAFEGDSQVIWFEGNYQAYEADRRKRLGHDADRPHRIRYRPLERQ